MTWSGVGARSWLLAGCPYPNDVSKETNAISIKVLAHFLPPFHDVLQSAIETAQNMRGKHQDGCMQVWPTMPYMNVPWVCKTLVVLCCNMHFVWPV